MGTVPLEPMPSEPSLSTDQCNTFGTYLQHRTASMFDGEKLAAVASPDPSLKMFDDWIWKLLFPYPSRSTPLRLTIVATTP